MTVIKQVSANTPAHVANVARYLDDGRTIARGSQYIANEDRWEREMAATREAYGHDSPSRTGARSALVYHQVIAFNPDECSMNGGKMTPEKCMEFAREWARTRHPDQEVVWVLHRERCAADGTERFAVHLVVNRTDLETGRRYNEGPARRAKAERAEAMRELDRRWGLRQVRANERNSRVHAMQPTLAEGEMARRGIRTDKQYVRDAVKASVQEARSTPEPNGMRALAESLERKGVGMSVSGDGKDLVFERRSTGRKVGGHRLGRGFSIAGITRAVGMRTAREMGRAAEEGMEDDG